jgi:cobalt/nickel transport system permease protein
MSDPRLKLAGTVGLTVLAVSCGVEQWPVWALCLALLCVAAAGARVRPGVLWRRVQLVLPLVLFVAAFTPFVREGETVWSLGPLSVSDAGLQTFIEVSAKALIGTLGAALLAATTPVPDLLRALRWYRVPRTFVLIAQVMWRYLAVIGDEVRRTRTALVARGFRPRHALQAGAAGQAAGALFLRAHARGERVHLAMLARGGRGGELPAAALPGVARADVLLVGTALAAALALRMVTA